MNVVHISASALAGAPGMLSEALEDFGLVASSVHFRAGDYRLERNVFSPESIPLYNSPRDRELFEKVYASADVVHIHNFAPVFVMEWIAQLGIGQRKFVYQIHSPVFERPTYDALADYHGVRFHHRLVIGHFHPRQNPKYEVVPNCLYRRRYMHRSKFVPEDDGRLRVFYSPSTAARGRWTEKTSEEFLISLDQCKAESNLKIELFENVSPQTLAVFRALADVTIDEVVTGSYHLVSYEGLAAGTVVVNGADELSIAAFRMAFESPRPPFVFATPRTLVGTLLDLNRDRNALAQLKNESRRFFEEWMNPEKVARVFRDIYGR